MARSIPPDRLADIARAACETFTANGFRRTLMTDVAEHLGLSVGVLYRSVDSKDALFHLALLYAMDPVAVDGLTSAPITSVREALEPLRTWIDANATFPRLDAALGATDVVDIRAELAGVVDELYRVLERHRRLLSLIEASAADLPELDAVYFGGARRQQVERLHAYLIDRRAGGHLRAVVDEGVASRFLIETVAWFAWHRHGDATGALLDDDVVRADVLDLVVAAFVPDGTG